MSPHIPSAAAFIWLATFLWALAVGFVVSRHWRAPLLPNDWFDEITEWREEVGGVR